MMNLSQAVLLTFRFRFDELMDSLLKLLVGMRVGPLSQLLLRLDFNYWFSLRTKSNKTHTSSITV